MRTIHGVATLALAWLAMMPAQGDPLPLDTPVQVNGLQTVCTGIGESKADPRWKSYPIRIEFSNRGAQYLSGATVDILQGQTRIASFDCLGAWVLLKATPGKYLVKAAIDGSKSKPVDARFKMGGGAQKRIVLRFADFPPNE